MLLFFLASHVQHHVYFPLPFILSKLVQLDRNKYQTATSTVQQRWLFPLNIYLLISRQTNTPEGYRPHIP